MLSVFTRLVCILIVSITIVHAETNVVQHPTAVKHSSSTYSTVAHATSAMHANMTSQSATSKHSHNASKSTSKTVGRKHISTMKHASLAHRSTSKHNSHAITEAIDISQLVDFGDNAAAVRNLIIKAQQLSEMHLSYLYGSADPRNHGMDCSGTIQFLLRQTPLGDSPRQSDQIFDWLERQGTIHPADDTQFNSDFDALKPGDLLFWSSTYETHRVSPISHVMLYIGKNKYGQRLMFGSSDGRTYQGKHIRGVSLFDFKLPTGRGKQRFVGYGCIPNLTCR